MARSKPNTQNNTKTRRTPRRNSHLEKNTLYRFNLLNLDLYGCFTTLENFPWRSIQ